MPTRSNVKILQGQTCVQEVAPPPAFEPRHIGFVGFSSDVQSYPRSEPIRSKPNGTRSSSRIGQPRGWIHLDDLRGYPTRLVSQASNTSSTTYAQVHRHVRTHKIPRRVRVGTERTDLHGTYMYKSVRCIASGLSDLT